MRTGLKLAAYVVLIACAVWLSYGFYKTFSAPVPPSVKTAPPRAQDSTNGVAAGEVPGTETNLTDDLSTGDDPTDDPSSDRATVAPESVRSTGKVVGYFGGLLAVLGVLALLVGRDVSHYLGSHALRVIYNDEGEGLKNPEYEQAEQAWANGHALEAIQLMRDYLKKHPREQYVALRIAEIYENDLKNYLAAALEYEEVLKHRLPDERWGWAAIHLANLYSGRLGKHDEAIALLRRIVSDYRHTAAAKKARERLEKLDPQSLEDEPPIAPESTAVAEKPPPRPSNLPPGFRPKK
jgi:TolA-binding protein